MTFEEFFRKKKIALDAFEKAEPGLFSEFKTHYGQMGEKSFDHTKKYWFNKLRLQFPVPIEVKTEKVKIDNPLAEQTITESLAEQAIPAPKLGFTPKFRAATMPKPTETPVEEIKAEEPAAAPAPKLGFTPKFRAAAMPKPTETPVEETKAEEPAAAPAPKLGFTPKFKAANLPKPAEPTSEEPKPAETTDIPTPEPSKDESAPKPAYKPRFNMKNLPKKDEE